MNETDSVKYLYEVSWEVCNKVGGIHTVLKTKAEQAVKNFGDNYVLIGPDVGNNPGFEETREDIWDKVIRDVASVNLTCRCGRWTAIGSRPRVVLIGYNNKYQVNKLLFQMWQNYGVDSLKGEWDYIEPVLFSTAAGEIIQILHKLMVGEDEVAVAQFHEWMCGAGMLYIKKAVPAIATVFTTHATMLGRSLAGNGINIYDNIEDISPKDMAAKMNITAKHSMESVSAREADCFTTVSDITAREAAHFLQKSPSVVLPNGMNISEIPTCSEQTKKVEERRQVLLDFSSKFLQEKLPDKDTEFFLISGRYEFRNKGLDLFLESLKKTNDHLKSTNSQKKVVAIVGVIGEHLGISNETSQILKGTEVQRSGISRICTHQLRDPQHDPIWNACNELGLLNYPDDPVKIIFMPVYLDGYDGLINMPYYDVLSGCNLGVFPSYYEPWGYTPLESASHCVPTITTDLAGFGIWVKTTFGDSNEGVIILDYLGRSREQIVNCLSNHFFRLLGWSEEEMLAQRRRARAIAEKTDWKEFYANYLHAYTKALKKAINRMHMLDTSAYSREIYYTGTDSPQPRFKNFSVVAALPKNIKSLRDIAYNLWWTWIPEIKELFARLDPKLWAEVSNNPIELLERVSVKRLREMADNDAYIRLYRWALSLIEDKMKDKEFLLKNDPSISQKNPIAYFSTEYGLHESLPIYSGGLGILSGDHLKSASDMNMPMVGIGLLYKSGYFYQSISKEGDQIALYPDNDFSRMPVRICENGNHGPLKIHVELPGRKLYAQAWKVDVGRTTLYLLDTYVPENNPQDMKITSRLYGADQRLRIEQEIMLGIGGVKLLDALGIKPALYHLNEGHSAFLLIERMRRLMEKEGLNFYEAREVVKSSSVFTTHSPVEAANEQFEEPLMKSCFYDYIKDLGIPWETFWELGREEPGAGKPFFMCVLAFKLTCFSNAVSKLHGKVSRKMWKNVWAGYEEAEIPILDVTNGVHMQSWVAPEMKEVYERYLGIDWYSKEFDKLSWSNIDAVPDKVLWQAHTDLKNKMVDYLKERISCDCEQEGMSPRLIRDKVATLNPDALIIGFARRFASYKRATLLFSDIERLHSILKSASVPIHIIFSGKAHPNDDVGKKLIRQIYDYSFEDRFIDKIFFVENYDMEVARCMIQGVDLWLNNPARPREASGTSGMKVVINGGLNCSVLDGWWDEAYHNDNGWVIGEKRNYVNRETQDIVDSESFYDVLEKDIIPVFRKRDDGEVPEKWLYMMKQSIKTLVPRFNTHRMLREYYEKLYLPTAIRSERFRKNNYEKAKALSDWKMKIASRFSTDHIRWFRTEGFIGDRIDMGGSFKVEVGVDLGKLDEEEMKLELVILELDEKDKIINTTVVPMKKTSADDKDALIYSCAYEATKSGKFRYGIRAIPRHPDLLVYQEIGLVHWA